MGLWARRNSGVDEERLLRGYCRVCRVADSSCDSAIMRPPWGGMQIAKIHINDKQQCKKFNQ